MTSKKLQTAAKLYLVASRMDTELTVTTMERTYGYNSEILDAVTKARGLLQKTATSRARLAESALVQLVRYNGDRDSARMAMVRRHPCNMDGQIEEAILSAYPGLDGYDSNPPFMEASGPLCPDVSGAVPSWSAAFARICDVPEEAGVPVPGCGGTNWDMPVDMLDERQRRDLAMSAKTYLIRDCGDEDSAREMLGERYAIMPEDLDWAVAEGRRLLRADAAGLDYSGVEWFSWMQMVCGLFGRKNVRDWIILEYPGAEEFRMDHAIGQASKRLASDIEEAGVEVAAPAVAYKYATIDGKKPVVRRKSGQQWRYLDDDLIDRMFAAYEKHI